ncbi:hypothetical protein DFH08DRAFT_335232 [Mycena albidolilacea]|uniref:Uncharacterized protein n=1 Tax=Mycena albidolilacea TaxID=1033008 RepID=A0AAD7EHL3_9AGAR|nr:hypothetical protein DFH08DRAFT_335232 [Mycena albidolilacea]
MHPRDVFFSWTSLLTTMIFGFSQSIMNPLRRRWWCWLRVCSMDCKMFFSGDELFWLSACAALCIIFCTSSPFSARATRIFCTAVLGTAPGSFEASTRPSRNGGEVVAFQIRGNVNCPVWSIHLY